MAGVDIIARAMAAKALQESGSGGGQNESKFNISSATVYEVGGIPAGTVLEGKTWQQILTLMLFGDSIVVPTLTPPSFRVELNEKYAVIGSQMTITGTAIFDRGKIEPAYGTSGFRSGLPNHYSVNGNDFNTTTLQYKFSVQLDILPGENKFPVAVFFDAGEQPKDGVGNNYDTPYPAGSLSVEAIVTGTYPVYSGNADNTEPMDIQQQFNEEGILDVSVPSEGTSDPRQTIMFPTESTPPIVGVQQYDEGRQVWDWIYGSPEASLTAFTTSQTTVMINGLEVDYTVWTNAAMRIGDRILRFFTKLPSEE